MQLLPPLRFRFVDEQDIAAYGDGWWVWDEEALAGLRGRDLIALEETVDMALPVILRGVHDDKALAKLAAMWIVLHRAGHPAKWDDFNPVVYGVRWEAFPLDETADSGDAPTPASTSSPEPTAESASS